MLRLTESEHEHTTLTCAHCGAQRVILVNCGNRFCPVCSRSNAAKVRKRLSYVLKNLDPGPKESLSMITLSMPNCASLPEGLKELVSAFRKLRQSRRWKYYVSGGAFVIEITGHPGSWHPHFHILAYSRFYPWEVLRKQWYKLTGGTGVFIQRIDGTKAMNYVTKYLTKADVVPDALYDVNAEIRKYRLFQRFGTWHAVRIPKLKSDLLCEICQDHDWLTEWDIRRFSKSHFSSG